MKNEKNDQTEKAPTEDEIKKLYVTPRLITHGNIERITKGLGNGDSDVLGQGGDSLP